MPTINLYKPPKIDITVDFPTAWNALQHKELIYVAKTLLTQSEPAVIKGFLLKFIIENRAASPIGVLKKSERLAKLPHGWFNFINAEQAVIDAYPLLDFIFKENNLSKDPQPITIGQTTYHPQPFEEITCAEFEDVEVIVNQFIDEPSVELLSRLAAILFRPMISTNGRQVIEPYMQINLRTKTYYTYQSDQKAKHFKKLLPEELYAIFIWYAGNRSQLSTRFPTVYEGGNTEEMPDLAAFTKCIHMGAGPKNGTRQQIRMMTLFEFMFDMEQEAVRAKEMEAEYERMKHQ